MNDAAFLAACLYFAVIAVVIWGIYKLVHRYWPNAGRGWFGELADDIEDVSNLDALDFAARDREFAARLEREWEQRQRAQAPRRRGQDLPAIESIGDRSLDDIRRDFGGDAA